MGSESIKGGALSFDISFLVIFALMLLYFNTGGWVANIALIELDRLIERQVVPLYYGRYVDDLILVMENGSDIQSTEQLWEWLFARSGGLLCWLS